MDKKVYNKIELQYIKEKDIIIFQQLRNGIMGQTINLPGKGGRKISVAAYRLSQRIKGNIRAIRLQLHK